MARIFCIPGAALIFGAFVLNLIVSISLPYLPALDITRTHFNDVVLENGKNPMTELRFGIWAPCFYNSDGDRTCSKLGNTVPSSRPIDYSFPFNQTPGYAYSISVTDNARSNQVAISVPWTRGLAIHPVAAIASLLATALALSEHVTVALMATLSAWLASLLTVTAFIVDIALFAWTKHQFKKLNAGANTITGPGFWITFAAFIILLIGGFSTCFGRIKERRASHHAKELSTASTAKDTEAATHVHLGEKNDKAEDDSVQPTTTAGKFAWANKFKFGKKSQA